MITTRQVEAWSAAMKQVRLDEPSLPDTNKMTLQQWTFLTARGVIKAGLIEDLDKDIDIDEVEAWRVEAIGEAWRTAYDEAMTIPKKNGSKKLQITFTTTVPLPPT